MPSRERSQVYAFDRCIAGLVGALSNVIVPLLAQFVFHYSTKHDPRPEGHLTAVRPLNPNLLTPRCSRSRVPLLHRARPAPGGARLPCAPHPEP